MTEYKYGSLPCHFCTVIYLSIATLHSVTLLFSAILNSESIKPLKKYVKHWESLNKYEFIQFSQHRFKNYRRVLLSKYTNALKQQTRCKNEKKARALVIKQPSVVVTEYSAIQNSNTVYFQRSVTAILWLRKITPDSTGHKALLFHHAFGCTQADPVPGQRHISSLEPHTDSASTAAAQRPSEQMRYLANPAIIHMKEKIMGKARDATHPRKVYISAPEGGAWEKVTVLPELWKCLQSPAKPCKAPRPQDHNTKNSSIARNRAIRSYHPNTAQPLTDNQLNTKKKAKNNVNSGHTGQTDESFTTKYEPWEEGSEEGQSNQFSTSWK